MRKVGYVYILSNRKQNLYIGVTSQLSNRIWQHKTSKYTGFTQKYKCYKLVYFEVFDSIKEAISREKQLKRWHREWKLNLIRLKNPEFLELFHTISEWDYSRTKPDQ